MTIPVPSGPPAAQRKQPTPTPPQIASSAIERADKQMAQSAALTAFLAGTAYQINKQGYWTKTGSRAPIGLVREITFAKPINTKMQPWPAISWRDDNTDFRQCAFNAQYKNVTKALIYLTNDTGVVAIAPGEGAITIQGPRNKEGGC